MDLCRSKLYCSKVNCTYRATASENNLGLGNIFSAMEVIKKATSRQVGRAETQSCQDLQPWAQRQEEYSSSRSPLMNEGSENHMSLPSRGAWYQQQEEELMLHLVSRTSDAYIQGSQCLWETQPPFLKKLTLSLIAEAAV